MDFSPLDHENFSINTCKTIPWLNWLKWFNIDRFKEDEDYLNFMEYN